MSLEIWTPCLFWSLRTVLFFSFSKGNFVWSFSWFATIRSLMNLLSITVSAYIVVLRMLLYLLKPRSISAWPWLRVSNNFITKDIKLHLVIGNVPKWNWSSWSLSNEKLLNSILYCGKSSIRKVLNSVAVRCRSHFCRVKISSSIRHSSHSYPILLRHNRLW